MKFPDKLQNLVDGYVTSFWLVEDEVVLLQKLLREGRSAYEHINSDSNYRIFPIASLSLDEQSLIASIIEKQSRYDKAYRSFGYINPGDLYTKYLLMHPEGKDVFFIRTMLADVLAMIINK